jgi:type VI protein secretion system component VasF
MIARPPEKKSVLKARALAPLFTKVANDNRPPAKILIGWVLLGAGILLLVGALLWI